MRPDDRLPPNDRLWLWVPACAGTTARGSALPPLPTGLSPCSLPPTRCSALLPSPLRGGVGGGGSRGSQTSPIIRAISSRSACHKTGKILPKTLPKAQRRWYIPPAPDGLAAHGNAFSGRYWDGSIGAPRAAALFRSPLSGQGAQRLIAGWSSPVARQAHNLKVASSNLAPATKHQALGNASFSRAFCCS